MCAKGMRSVSASPSAKRDGRKTLGMLFKALRQAIDLDQRIGTFYPRVGSYSTLTQINVDPFQSVKNARDCAVKMSWGGTVMRQVRSIKMMGRFYVRLRVYLAFAMLALLAAAYQPAKGQENLQFPNSEIPKSGVAETIPKDVALRVVPQALRRFPHP